MPFTSEQAEEIKKKLLDQVENLKQDNKEEIKEYVKNLNPEELEEFLKQNKIQISQDKDIKDSESKECVFCSISKGKIPSYKILENNKSVAVLEINPLSKGHSIILPKEHLSTEKIPKNAMSLAQKVAKKIKKKLKPEDIKIETSNFMGHAMINVIPLYKDIQIKKYQADEKELKQIQKKLELKTRSKRKKERTEDSKEELENLSKIPKVSDFRIP